MAVKLARSDRRITDRMIRQFHAEARHAASLKHPGIVPVYDVGRTARGMHLVAEYVPGETLGLLLRRGAIPPRQAVNYTIQLADALHHAHLQGLVHRDVKPGNILLRAGSGEAVLTDFGLAVTELDQLQESGSTVGTFWYMSPEQARGESHRVDARSDLFSLGVVLYQMLTGRLPFVASKHEEYIDQLLHRPPRPLRTIDDTLDPELERICLRCLAKSVTERFTTGADLSAALREWSRQTATAVQETTTPAAGAAAPARGRSVSPKWLAGVLLGLAALAAGTVRILPPAASSQPGAEPPIPTRQAAFAPSGQRPRPPQDDSEEPDVRKFLAEPPQFFAQTWGAIPEPPRFDTLQRTYSVRSEGARWLATVGETRHAEFELSAEISVQEWIGCGGLIWQLAVDTRLAPERGYHCLGLEYQRMSAEAKPALRLKEFVIKEQSFDHRRIEHIGTIAVLPIDQPEGEWVTLKCRVGPERITAWFNDGGEWVAQDEGPDRGWIPAHAATSIGVTGFGGDVKVRNLMLQSVR